MLHHLNWRALFHRRNICILSMLYKITHRLVAIDQNLYLVPQTTTITPSSSLSDLQYTNTAFFLTQRHCGTPFHTRWYMYQQPLCLLTVQVSID